MPYINVYASMGYVGDKRVRTQWIDDDEWAEMTGDEQDDTAQSFEEEMMWEMVSVWTEISDEEGQL